jgi:hypothetical protein
MTLELLFLLLVAKYRYELIGLFVKEEEPDDYERDLMDALTFDAPQPSRHLRLLK